MSKKKLHLFDPQGITNSVLNGIEIEALCGLRKQMTREDVDAARGSTRPSCVGCLKAIGEIARHTDVAIRTPVGWTGLLEQQQRSVRWTYTSSSTTWNFPLAG